MEQQINQFTPTQQATTLQVGGMSARLDAYPNATVTSSVAGSLPDWNYASSDLSYYFEVTGEPNTLIKINFEGYIWQYGTLTTHLSNYNGQAYLYNSVRVSQVTNFYDEQSREEIYIQAVSRLYNNSQYSAQSVELRADAPPGRSFVQSSSSAGYYSSNSAAELYSSSLVGQSSIYAPFDGYLSAFSDLTGKAILNVVITSAASMYDAEGSVTGVADPSFSIDSDYLAAHPNAQLAILGGIGNSVASPVPEPSAMLTLLAGFFFVLGAKRLNKVSGPQKVKGC